jgi:hypothetical protein
MAALEADERPYRLRRGEDAVWPPRERAYGGAVETTWKRAERPRRIGLRLVLPVLLMVTLLGAAYLYPDAYLAFGGAPAIVQRAMLAVSDLILPMAWTTLHLTNRRYGAPYAFGQLLAGLGIVPVRQFRRHHPVRRGARRALVDGTAGGILHRQSVVQRGLLSGRLRGRTAGCLGRQRPGAFRIVLRRQYPAADPLRAAASGDAAAIRDEWVLNSKSQRPLSLVRR